MNRDRLQRALDAAGIRADAYSLHGGLPSEAYTLEERPDGRAVYYSVRGRRNGEVVHTDEAAAGRHLLALVIADRSTREWRHPVPQAFRPRSVPATTQPLYTPAERDAIARRAHAIRVAWGRGEPLAADGDS